MESNTQAANKTKIQRWKMLLGISLTTTGCLLVLIMYGAISFGSSKNSKPDDIHDNSSNATDEPVKQVNETTTPSISPTRSPTHVSETTTSSISPTMSPTDVAMMVDIPSYIATKLATGEKYIRIPSGRHYVDPREKNGRVGLLLENINDVTIDGTDAELIMTKTTRAIEINNCTNFALIGLTVDYDPLPFMQGWIIDMSENKDALTIKLMDGYPEAGTFYQDKIEIYSPIDDELTTQTYYGVAFTALSDDIIRVKKQNGNPAYMYEQIGDIVVIDSKTSDAIIPHAIQTDSCMNLMMEDVTVYTANMFGFLETNCNGSKYINCAVDRRPVGSDSRARAYKRLRSSTADHFHSKHAEKGPSYVGCTARYGGDDGFAINGDYHIISRVEGGDTLRVIPKLGMVPNLHAGDEAELINYNGQRIQNAKIVVFDKNAGMPLDDADMNFLNRQHFTGATEKTKEQVTEAFNVTLDRNVDLPTGSLIASANRIGNGFEIRNCVVGPLRSRGIIVKASDGVITNNTIVDTWGHAILAAPEYSWLEGGSGNNLIISNNSIQRSHDVGIAVTAHGGSGQVAPEGAHNDITITNNIINASSRPAIAITSTTNLIERNNDIGAQRNYYLLPHQIGMYGRGDDPTRKVYTTRTTRA